MPKVITFDPKDVTVIYDGLVITGFAEDGMIEAEKNEDNMIPHVDILGNVSVAINADNTGKVTIPLNYTSPFIKILSDKANSHTIAPFSVVNMNENGVDISATQAFVIKPPDIKVSKEIDSTDVEFFLADYTTD